MNKNYNIIKNSNRSCTKSTTQPTETPFNLFRLVYQKERSKDHEKQYASIAS